jgi:hypothetical protein
VELWYIAFAFLEFVEGGKMLLFPLCFKKFPDYAEFFKKTKDSAVACLDIVAPLSS